MANPIAGRVTQYKPGIRDPQVAPRWAAAVRLRADGRSYQAIARQLGYANRAGARQAVMKTIQAYPAPAEVIAMERRLELVRLDALQAAVWERATSGDNRAVDLALRIMERRAALLGLDSPLFESVISASDIIHRDPTL